MKHKKIAALPIVLCLLAAAALAISIFVPLWRIELDAPQYPEGLALLIYPNMLAGDVDIINGLNHYIGMGTLHAENFVEFTVLPYIIGAFSVLCLMVAILRRKGILFGVTILFIIFGLVAMYDFWQWEYEYGHNLDPNAAIKVPGMAYQPPLIGFKQLLNFGAYSIPDTGGWLFIVAGICLVSACIIEIRGAKKISAHLPAIILISATLMLTGCGTDGPEPIVLNKDQCNYCKMTISDEKFACQIMNDKGRIFKFDDLECLKAVWKEQQGAQAWVTDYRSPGKWMPATEAFYVTSEALRSPMGGNTAAFSSREVADTYASQQAGQTITWSTIIP